MDQQANALTLLWARSTSGRFILQLLAGHQPFHTFILTEQEERDLHLATTPAPLWAPPAPGTERLN